MVTNDKYMKIRNQLFGGDLGKEAKVQNEFLLSLAIKQDILIECLTEEQKVKFDLTMTDWTEFCDNARSQSLKYYSLKQNLLNKKTIFKQVEEKQLNEEI
tara:strand:+ start:1552 stop:1851 length:300 start_codon:yes stop_codon:yes gene_type:complete